MIGTVWRELMERWKTIKSSFSSSTFLVKILILKDYHHNIYIVVIIIIVVIISIIADSADALYHADYMDVQMDELCLEKAYSIGIFCKSLKYPRVYCTVIVFFTTTIIFRAPCPIMLSDLRNCTKYLSTGQKPFLLLAIILKSWEVI